MQKAYQGLAFSTRFAEYKVGKDGVVRPAAGAERDDYDPWIDYRRSQFDPEHRPPYEDFLRLANAPTEADVLAWAARHGSLGLGRAETVSAIIREARRFAIAAEDASGISDLDRRDDLSSRAIDTFDLVLTPGQGYGPGVRLMARNAVEDDRLRWEIGLYSETLIQTYYAMLLLDLSGGREVRRCECGSLFTVRAGSKRAYCPPDLPGTESTCYLRFKKRRQRARHPSKGDAS
jgi:hypothetical protein